MFTRLGPLGVTTGELSGLTVQEATELLPIAIMGWTLERHHRPTDLVEAASALKKLFALLAQGGSR